MNSKFVSITILFDKPFFKYAINLNFSLCKVEIINGVLYKRLKMMSGLF
jgi:hypothetical protein